MKPQRNSDDSDAIAPDRIEARLRDADGRQQAQTVNSTDTRPDFYDSFVPKLNVKRSGRKR